MFEFRPEDDCEPEVAKIWDNIPNVQHLIVAGELDDKGYRTRAIELWRRFDNDPDGKTFVLSRVAYSYDAYAEIRAAPYHSTETLTGNPAPLTQYFES